MREARGSRCTERLVAVFLSNAVCSGMCLVYATVPVWCFLKLLPNFVHIFLPVFYFLNIAVGVMLHVLETCTLYRGDFDRYIAVRCAFIMQV